MFSSPLILTATAILYHNQKYEVYPRVDLEGEEEEEEEKKACLSYYTLLR